jgi:hypothetical protein
MTLVTRATTILCMHTIGLGGHPRTPVVAQLRYVVRGVTCCQENDVEQTDVWIAATRCGMATVLENYGYASRMQFLQIMCLDSSMDRAAIRTATGALPGRDREDPDLFLVSHLEVSRLERLLCGYDEGWFYEARPRRAIDSPAPLQRVGATWDLQTDDLPRGFVTAFIDSGARLILSDCGTRNMIWRGGKPPVGPSWRLVKL